MPIKLLATSPGSSHLGRSVVIFSDTPGMRTGYTVSYSLDSQTWKIAALFNYLARHVQAEEKSVPVHFDD